MISQKLILITRELSKMREEAKQNIVHIDEALSALGNHQPRRTMSDATKKKISRGIRAAWRERKSA